MKNFWVNCCFLASLISLGTLGTALNANAALITYDLQVDIDFGPFTGNVYKGGFTYNDYGLSGIDNESLPLTSFNFTFDGNPYTLADDPGAIVSFLDGQFLGLDYAVTSPPFPTFISGTLDLSDAFFSYDLGGSGSAGTGVTTYRQIVNETVPEPSCFWGLLLLSAILILKSRRCSKQGNSLTKYQPIK